MNPGVVVLAMTVVTGIVAMAIATWMPRRIGWLAVLLPVTVMAGSYWLISTLPGQPRMVCSETVDVAEAEVLWSGPVPEEGVDVLLRWPGVPARLYRLPWDPRLSVALAETGFQARARGMPFKVRKPFDDCDWLQTSGGGRGSGHGQGRPGKPGARGRGSPGDRAGDDVGIEPRFYSPPPRPLPPKAASDDAAEEQAEETTEDEAR